MYSTIGKKRCARAVRASALVAALVCAREVNGSLLSSDIYSLAGNGDTLWVASSHGLNFALDTSDTTPSWWASKARDPWALAFGESRAIAATDISTRDDNVSTSFVSSFLLYDHAAAQALSRTLTVRWTHAPDTLARSAVCYAAVRGRGAWWMAFHEAGLARWDGAADAAVLFTPGVDRAVSQSGAFPSAAAAAGIRTTRSTLIGVAADTSIADSLRIYTAAPARVWRFSPADSSWDTLANVFDDPAMTLVEYNGVFVDASRPAPRVLTSAKVKRLNDTISCLFVYDTTGVWRYFYGRGQGQSAVRGVSFARGAYIYVADSTGVSLFIDTANVPVRIADPAYFRARMLSATDVVAWEVLRVNDIAALRTTDSTVTLWIATTEGLFYARDEKPSERNSAPFDFVRRDVPVKADLAQTFARPGILNERMSPPRTEFVYSLASPARVTIRIYDWNMDHVKTIVDNEPRREGGSGASTVPSTDPAKDVWDGTNTSGRIVAPGVYYYKITTDKGGRALGKIVVALTR